MFSYKIMKPHNASYRNILLPNVYKKSLQTGFPLLQATMFSENGQVLFSQNLQSIVGHYIGMFPLCAGQSILSVGCPSIGPVNE